jgi:AcrR family transcriptional regulator
MGVKERREREKEELRQKILDAAIELIARDGHEALTIRKLASRIEYSPRTIYLYFADKEALLEDVVEEGFRRTLAIRAKQAEADKAGTNEAPAYKAAADEERTREAPAHQAGARRAGSRDGAPATGSPEEIVAARIRAHVAAAFGQPNVYRAVISVIFARDYAPGEAQRTVVGQTRVELAALVGETDPEAPRLDLLTMTLFASVRAFTLSLLNRSDTGNARTRDEMVTRFIRFLIAGLRAA